MNGSGSAAVTGQPAEVLVVGGGVAGASLAARLARAGRRVVLVERSRGAHHKVCGEFLSHEALAYLQAGAVDVAALGALPLTHVRLLHGERREEQRLPFRAASLPRSVLDEALLAAACSAGVRVVRCERVERLQPDGEDCWVAELGSGERLRAPAVFLATGKHDLRGHARPPGRQNSLLALKTYLRVSPEVFAGHGAVVELGLFAGGYAGLQPVAPGVLNLCLLVERERFRALGAAWAGVWAHVLRECPAWGRSLGRAELEWAAPLALFAIPYGMVRRETAPGLWPLGDQAVVIPSFAGEGISLALHSARVAAEAYLRGACSGEYLEEFAAGVGWQMRRATWISRALVRAPGFAAAAAWACPALLGASARATRIPGGVGGG